MEVVEGSDGWMMEEDSFQRREGVSESSMFIIVSTATGKLPRLISISFPIAIVPVSLVLTYIVMFPDAKALCEVAR